MSWLYTIIFAGLLYSSQTGTEPTPYTGNANAVPAVAAARADETEKLDQSYPLNANGRVSVSNIMARSSSTPGKRTRFILRR
jgi:hypothetical protein